MQLVDTLCTFIEELISTTFNSVEIYKLFLPQTKKIYIQKQTLNLPEF